MAAALVLLPITLPLAADVGSSVSSTDTSRVTALQAAASRVSVLFDGIPLGGSLRCGFARSTNSSLILVQIVTWQVQVLSSVTAGGKWVSIGEPSTFSRLSPANTFGGGSDDTTIACGVFDGSYSTWGARRAQAVSTTADGAALQVTIAFSIPPPLSVVDDSGRGVAVIAAQQVAGDALIAQLTSFNNSALAVALAPFLAAASASGLAPYSTIVLHQPTLFLPSARPLPPSPSGMSGNQGLTTTLLAVAIAIPLLVALVAVALGVYLCIIRRHLSKSKTAAATDFLKAASSCTPQPQDIGLVAVPLRATAVVARAPASPTAAFLDVDTLSLRVPTPTPTPLVVTRREGGEGLTRWSVVNAQTRAPSLAHSPKIEIYSAAWAGGASSSQRALHAPRHMSAPPSSRSRTPKPEVDGAAASSTLEVQGAAAAGALHPPSTARR